MLKNKNNTILLLSKKFLHIYIQYEFVNSKQSKNKYVFRFSFSLLYILCVPLFPTYTTLTITITACSMFFSHKYLLFCSQRRS